MKTGYSGIIFDFNGTLFFDSDKQEESWEIISMRLRGRAFGKQEMQRRMHGRSGKSIFEYLLERDVPDDEVLRLMAEKEEIYRELCLKDRERFHLAPGAVELLDWIKERRIPRTIATASEIVNVTFFIRSFGLERWFDPEKIVYDDGTLPGKPNPDIYLKAARSVSLRGRRRCRFGDRSRPAGRRRIHRGNGFRGDGPCGAGATGRRRPGDSQFRRFRPKSLNGWSIGSRRISGRKFTWE